MMELLELMLVLATVVNVADGNTILVKDNAGKTIPVRLVQQGKSKKAKVKRKNADFVGCLAIFNGWFIYADLY